MASTRCEPLSTAPAPGRQYRHLCCMRVDVDVLSRAARLAYKCARAPLSPHTYKHACIRHVCEKYLSKFIHNVRRGSSGRSDRKTFIKTYAHTHAHMLMNDYISMCALLRQDYNIYKCSYIYI